MFSADFLAHGDLLTLLGPTDEVVYCGFQNGL